MRRAVLTRRLLLGTPCVAPTSMPGWAQDAAPPPVVIGVLTDRTGIGEAVSGPPLVQAVRMAAQDTGTLPDGRTVSVVTTSYWLRPDDALAIAGPWFDRGVSAIVEVPGSAAAVAVQALARSRGRTMLVTGRVNPALTGRDCSPFGSSWGIDSISMTTALVGALARSGTKTGFWSRPTRSWARRCRPTRSVRSRRWVAM
jgi:branched-chain amino acid transport system substrate-binding protein